MAKLISISFLFVFLCANTELHQLLRFPVLIHHYLEHHKENPNESIADFFNDHYNEFSKHSANAHQDHKNLPFKTSDCATAHVSIAFLIPIQSSIVSLNIFQDNILPVNNGIIYFSALVSNIWQPPKIS